MEHNRLRFAASPGDRAEGSASRLARSTAFCGKLAGIATSCGDVSTGGDGVSELDVPLASAIEVLRNELVEAVRAGKDQEIRFALGPIELELQVAVEKKADGQAGIKFWLVSVGGGAGRSSGTTHTLRLKLTPTRGGEGSEGKDVLVASDLEERDWQG
jgi:Trypsin-co-occurring domain 2